MLSLVLDSRLHGPSTEGRAVDGRGRLSAVVERSSSGEHSESNDRKLSRLNSKGLDDHSVKDRYQVERDLQPSIECSDHTGLGRG